MAKSVTGKPVPSSSARPPARLNWTSVAHLGVLGAFVVSLVALDVELSTALTAAGAISVIAAGTVATAGLGAWIFHLIQHANTSG